MIDEYLREYYKRAPIWLPPDHRHRYFKFIWKYPKRSALHIRDIIRTEEHLRRYLVRHAPHHVYYSTTTWLDPTTIHGRRSTGIPLWSDLVLDIDMPDLRAAAQETKKLLSYLRSMGYHNFTIIFTGKKGFQVRVEDFRYPKYPEDPRERGKYFEKVKKKIIEELLSANISVDPELWDLYRVVRLPYTIHGSSLRVARIISENELDFFHGSSSEIIPDKPEKSDNLIAAMSITSHVLGTPDRHVIFIDIDINTQTFAEKYLQLRDTYALPDGFVFKTSKGYHVIIPKATTLKQVLKIKRAFGDDPVHETYIRKLGYDILRVGPKFSESRIETPPPEYVGTLFADPSKDLSKIQVSRGHIEFLRKMGVPLPPWISRYTQIGKPSINIVGAAEVGK